MSTVASAVVFAKYIGGHPRCLVRIAIGSSSVISIALYFLATAMKWVSKPLELALRVALIARSLISSS